MTRKKAQNNLIEGHYVYINKIDGLVFYVGCHNNVYEFRRYSNRPATWEAIARLKGGTYEAVIIADNMSEKVADMVLRLVKWFLIERLKRVPINCEYNLKKKPYVPYTIKNLPDFIEHIRTRYNINIRPKFHIMDVDMNKRNYHKEFLATE